MLSSWESANGLRFLYLATSCAKAESATYSHELKVSQILGTFYLHQDQGISDLLQTYRGVPHARRIPCVRMPIATLIFKCA